MTGFAGRTAIVTGGASGIGRALGAALAAGGARVVLADLDGAAATRVAAQLAATGGAVTGAALDVTDAAQVSELVERTRSAHGRLDLMFTADRQGVRRPRIAARPGRALHDATRGASAGRRVKARAPYDDPRAGTRFARSR